jgi:threonine dehydratase
MVMITLDDVKTARQRLAGITLWTPLVLYPDSQSDRRLYLKPENLQPVGAFKLRGAYNKIASLTAAEKGRGVIAFSSGNHAQGVAYAARALGVQATIVMPAIAPAVKVAKTRALGGQVVLLEEGGEEEWRVAAEELAAEQGYVMIPPFDDATIIAGQATVGLEIAAELPQVGLVLVPIGGGGLISGVAAALKLSGSPAKIVGVEPELANDAQLSFRRGRIETLALEQTKQTIADGMRATRVGRITFAHIQAYVDDIITVSEAEIKEAMRRMVSEVRLVPEPSGAVSLAAALFHRPELPDSDLTAAVISGGNVDSALLADILGAK